MNDNPTKGEDRKEKVRRDAGSSGYITFIAFLDEVRGFLAGHYTHRQAQLQHFAMRALRPTEAAEDISAKCLYLKGSEVANRGDLGVVFSVLYNLWVAVFIIALLSYEHKRLRFSRKVHSACVVGLIQTWM